jgi:MoaA/NifB/PqqE/SkfB family radical SAM enzyme
MIPKSTAGSPPFTGSTYAKTKAMASVAAKMPRAGNHHCTFCRTRPVLPPFLKRPFLNKTELESLGADLVKNPDTDVLISGGGEPLLNPNLEHFIDKVESLGPDQ